LVILKDKGLGVRQHFFQGIGFRSHRLNILNSGLAFSGYLSLQQYKDAPDLRALITYSTEQDKPSIFEIKPPISGIGGTGLTAKTLARAGFGTKRLPL
jgi:hypothetical protein